MYEKISDRSVRTLVLAVAALSAAGAYAQSHSVTGAQKVAAEQVAAQGVPVSDLAPNAPDTYVVKRGDTLWSISGLYLHKPWNWPKLWGMNRQSIANPHLIYPGQTLYLEKINGVARLRTGVGASGEPETVRVSPRTRYDSLSGVALPTLQPHLIEPFLVEAEVVRELTLEQAPRIVATSDERVIMGNGDRVYARGAAGTPLSVEPGAERDFRIFRNATPLKDPVSGEILGYEAQYVGKAGLVRGETTNETALGNGRMEVDPVPATLDLRSLKEEVRIGDRLLPMAKQGVMNYTPRAPQFPVDASVVGLYGSSAVVYAGQNQVVSINKGSDDGLEPGDVLTLLTQGDRMVDKTDDQRTTIKLPSEANGVGMVFRTFDRVSYVLLLKVSRGVRKGDRMVDPQ